MVMVSSEESSVLEKFNILTVYRKRIFERPPGLLLGPASCANTVDKSVQVASIDFRWQYCAVICLKLLHPEGKTVCILAHHGCVHRGLDRGA